MSDIDTTRAAQLLDEWEAGNTDAYTVFDALAALAGYRLAHDDDSKRCLAPVASADEEDEELATWPEHTNDLGDWCPWSGQPSGGVDGCPAMCRASYADED